MTGAAGMCALAAYRAGAGMVRLGIPGAVWAGRRRPSGECDPSPRRLGRRRPV